MLLHAPHEPASLEHCLGWHPGLLHAPRGLVPWLGQQPEHGPPQGADVCRAVDASRCRCVLLGLPCACARGLCFGFSLLHHALVTAHQAAGWVPPTSSHNASCRIPPCLHLIALLSTRVAQERTCPPIAHPPTAWRRAGEAATGQRGVRGSRPRRRRLHHVLEHLVRPQDPRRPQVPPSPSPTREPQLSVTAAA